MKQAKSLDKTRQDKTIVVGCLDGAYESVNRVYASDGVSPTINTYGGGNREAKILEVMKINKDDSFTTIDGGGTQQIKIVETKQLGHLEKGTGKHQSNIVYDINGTSPCICAGMGVKQQPTMIVEEEKLCCAMRGRNQDNPSDRTKGIELEQTLEIRQDDCCDCLTSVQKDNLVLEVKTMLYINKYFDFIYSERVINERNAVEILCLLREKISEEEISEWSIRGLWCILAKEILQQNVYAKSVFKNWENKPELFQFSYYSEKDEQIVFTETQVREMWKDWQIRCSSYRWRLEQQHRRKFDDFVQELSYENSSSKEIVCYMWKTCKGIGLLQQALYSVQEIWQSLHSMGENYYLIRIRKLTPKSCWKLMSFSDEDYEKASQVNSQTQLYKQAGNSLCTNVMMSIFSQLGIHGKKRWNDMSDNERKEFLDGC